MPSLWDHLLSSDVWPLVKLSLEEIPSVFCLSENVSNSPLFLKDGLSRSTNLDEQSKGCPLPFDLGSLLHPTVAALCEHPFPIAAVMNYHKVRGLKHHDLGFHSVGAEKSEVGTTGQNSGCRQLPSLPEALEENL